MLSEAKSAFGGEGGSRINPNVIVIVGPTCSGKSLLGITLAGLLNTEIISADSRQFYKKLNIGTAKPSEKELEKVKHHFIDILNPDDEFNVSKYSEEAEKVINDLLSRNKIPLVVGGSGLYIKSLIDGIMEIADKDDEYRIKLSAIKSKEGINKLYEMLQMVDPESAAKMLPQNWKRVMRALEVYHTTGEPIWKHHQMQSISKEKKYNFKQFGLNWDRNILYENIDNRVDEMIAQGFVEEVKNILSIGYDKNLNSLNTVGYKEIIQYFGGEVSLNRAIELIKRNTRHYAKRQLTWFRKDIRIQWFDINDLSELDQIAKKIIDSLN